MKFPTTRWAKLLALAVAMLVVAGCALPRSGPQKREIYSGSVAEGGNAYVVAVDDRVTRVTSKTPVLGFSSDFVNTGQVGSDTIRPGDTLGLTIWENVDDGLLADQGQSATALQEVQVDGAGFIFVPYAGRIKASGNTPERLRQIITEKLDAQTPDPQVLVTRVAGDGATVSVMGGVANQGVFAIERPTRTLSGMIAKAGGLTIPNEIAQINVVRGQHRSKIWFNDLFSDPRLDIALRGGDRILVEEDSRAFSVLGATGTQNRVRFESQTLSAVEALAQVGGLNSNLADPTGIFVFREEPESIARDVLGRSDVVGDQRVIYVLDLTEPNGLFEARDFVIRDGDTLYVTEAPFVSWQKTLSSVTGTLTPLANYATLTN